MPTSQTAADFTGIQSVATFKRVAKCVIGLAHKEIYHGKIPELTKWKGHAQDFNKSCLCELMKYARGMYPYSDRLSETGLALNWWRDIQSMQQEDAEILPVSKYIVFIQLHRHSLVSYFQILAIKLFSVRVNSMPEERTVSSFTWLTPSLRAAIKIGQVGAQTQIRQFYATEQKAC